MKRKVDLYDPFKREGVAAESAFIGNQAEYRPGAAEIPRCGQMRSN
ncbi:MAG: hypothetical protein PHX37_04275 [Eubacteriales bacterium]|nr:hypothetical protein [Eubacteriales bacterium]